MCVHPFEVGLTPIITNQQYTKPVYSQNKNVIGSSPDFFRVGAYTARDNTLCGNRVWFMRLEMCILA